MENPLIRRVMQFNFPKMAGVILRFLTLFLVILTVRAEVSVFDEDDSLGADFYDASVATVSAPSELTRAATGRDKLPTTKRSAASGKDAGVLEWTSRAHGHWRMRVYAPGFRILNAANAERIQVSLNAPEPIASNELPWMELEDTAGRRATIDLGMARPEGVDADPATWQECSVPLKSVALPRDFDPAHLKLISFAQNRPDGQKHLLWIDDLRLIRSDERPAVPLPPGGIIARSGDRAITLHWAAVTNAARYRVYRSRKFSGPFSELASSPVTIQSIADTDLENGILWFYTVRAENRAGTSSSSDPISIAAKPFPDDNAFLEFLQATAFDYFWFETSPQTGLVRDRSEPWSAASIAATGFCLTALGIGIDHGWITRERGLGRATRILHTLLSAPQNADVHGAAGFKGWFYHFLDPDTGLRFGASELSSIDSALLMAGVLYAREYFDRDTPEETALREMADRLFARIDWTWMLDGGPTLSMGWNPEHGFLQARWKGYNEASILYLLGLGAKPGNRLEPATWQAWTSTYEWKTSHGYSFIHFPPLFGHQYSACWINFREMADDYTASKQITYFENSRRATLAQRAWCAENPRGWRGYGPDVWGLTACDGPGANGALGYEARGTPPPEHDDGTLAPTAAGGSLPFTPRESLRMLRKLYDEHRAEIWCGYGFRDAFNLQLNWWGPDVIGIDQGPILIMAENARFGRVWKVMQRNEVIRAGLQRAGFKPVAREDEGQR